MSKNSKPVDIGAAYKAPYSQCANLSAQLSALQQEIKADYLFIASVDEDKSATTQLVLSNTEVIENFSYSLEGSPCELLLTQSICFITHKLQQDYPENKLLQVINANAYIGAAILNDDGLLTGVLVGLYFNAHQDLESYKSILLSFANYTSAYLQKCFLENKPSSQKLLTNAVESMAKVGSWQYTVLTDELYFSPEVYKIYALAADSKINTTQAIAHYADEEQVRISQLFRRLQTLGLPYCEDFEFVDAHGNKKWVRTSGHPVFNDDHQVIKVYGAFEDVTLEYELKAKVDDKNNRLEAILNNLNDAVITINQQGVIVHCNSTALTMFGYKQNEMLGLSINNLMPEPYASKHHSYMRNYEQTGEAKIIGVGRQLPARKKDGTIFQIELSLTKAVNEQNVEYIGVVRDISEKLKAQDTIYNLAYSDPITGLKNKRWFERECRSLLQSASINNGYIYAALLDMDKLAQFNFKYGIEAGNEALILTAKKLSNAVQGEYKLYKSGVDSFLIISANVSSDLSYLEQQQPSIDSKLLALDNFSHKINDLDVVLSASLGSTIINASRDSYSSMFDKLEYAQKQAKKLAPFGYYFADLDALKRYERTNKIRYLLINVDKSDELTLVLQPQFNNENTFNSAEALLRWDSEELGVISPREFIPLAEENEAIIKIGDWVVDQVCKLLHEVSRAGKNTCIAVNISAKQIVAPDFKEKLLASIHKWQVSPRNLVIELTETTLVSDIELVKETMLELNKKGFRFSIDDFGTGYSSLSYLKELPISELKIDKYFVDGIMDTDDNSSKTIVNMIIDMASALGVNSVAEGVEEPAQFNYLKQRGCNLFQGYLSSKPLPIEQWKERLQ
ncbi:EAL domain-containing protein [Pseudoalteromonas sp. SCSIO 43095]|uniref:sensor domain-containing protein n=1 Tax=Pseudoalteromonas sp. SCSIO 43095 TaxID=2894202 RepID=UPI00202AF8B6|nr:EAL domain-containing protein [Pseudoalteromonas sp. SCSIO 43095]URQ99006.1 EAL domain-containing protein [Pseudoalteromonas sp. SCSIO 43095]